MVVIQVIYSLTQGGAERFIVDLSNELAKKHEVILLTIRDDSISNYSFFKDEVSPEVKYINYPIKEGFRLSDIIKLNKFINSLQPDIIHAHLDTIFYFLLRTLFDKKVKVFHTIHNDAFFDGKKKIPTFIRSFFYRTNLVKPITISNESDLSFKKLYKTNNANLIYNGTRLPKRSLTFDNVKKEIFNIKTRENDKLFIHISRYSEVQKRHLILFEAFTRLKKEFSNIILIVIGSGFLEVSKSMKQKYPDGIFFLNEKNNVVDYLLESDAFCLSSQDEGLPIALLEALACGVTPICTPVGGMKDVIKHGITGYLSKEVTVDAYYSVLKEFMLDCQKIKKEQLKKYFADNFSIEVCALKHEKLYTKLLNKN